jgi:hypothetical protein
MSGAMWWLSGVMWWLSGVLWWVSGVWVVVWFYADEMVYGPLVVLYSEMVQVCRSADSGML